MSDIKHDALITNDCSGLRLDQALAIIFPQYSRERLKHWLKEGKITVDQKLKRPKDKVVGGERIIINAEMEEETHATPQNIALNIVYEDDDILVINKPSGMVVHPAAGNRDNTLLNALLYQRPQLAQLPRAGIVHRIDKDTSGLLVVAKTIEAHHYLVRQLEKRKIHREYEAIAFGIFTGGGTINAPLGRHPTQRTKMAVVENGKPAITHYRIIERFHTHTFLKVILDTGRTHQIRVHLAHIHHPIVGDQTYAGRLRLPKNASPQLIENLKTFKRQALHARRLSLKHPKTKTEITWECPLPNDMEELLTHLRQEQTNGVRSES